MTRILSLGLLLGLFANPAVADDKDDLEKLQGTWKLVSLEKDGKKQPEDAIKNFKVIIKDDKFILKDGNTDYEATIKLDTAKKPKTIDLAVKDGDKAETKKGIYQLDGDDLKLCVAGAPDGERPAEFATKPKAGVGLVVLKREKP